MATHDIRTVAVAGTGTIGASWTALFLAHGLDVIATDPADGAEDRLRRFVERALPDARPSPAAPVGRLSFVASVEQAVGAADFVQENAPEREAMKQQLIAELQQAAPRHVVIASSTTAFPQTVIAAKAADPARVIVAHPFNPPHLVPLVELVGSSPDVPAIETARAFYTSLGQQPVVLRKEAVGHLANRFQAAVMREALYCLEQGIASVEDLDKAVRYGPGLRWAFMGPFQTFHLAGGEGGIRHYIAHLWPSQKARWAALGTPNVDAALEEKVIAGVDAMTRGRPIADLEAERDAALIALRRALGHDESRD